MFAIIQTGSKQYSVKAGSEIVVEKLAGKLGDKIQLTNIVMKDSKIGTPFIEGASVEAEITKQGRLRKIFLFKKKRRKHYRRSGGHRQEMTWLKIGKLD